MILQKTLYSVDWCLIALVVGFRPKFFLDVLSQHVGAWIIVLMSHERYKAMINPHDYVSTYHRKTGYLLALLWISGAVASTPIAIYTEGRHDTIPVPTEGGNFTNKTLLHCGSTWDPYWQSVYFTSLTFIEYFIPVCFMVFYYIGVFKGYLRQTRFFLHLIHSLNGYNTTCMFIRI